MLLFNLIGFVSQKEVLCAPPCQPCGGHVSSSLLPKTARIKSLLEKFEFFESCSVAPRSMSGVAQLSLSSNPTGSP